MRSLFPLVALGIFVASVPAAVVDVPIVDDGLERRYLAYLPAAAIAEPDRLRPLVLALHGGGGDPEAMRNLTQQGFESLAESDDVLVVYPAGINKAWNDDRVAGGGDDAIDDVGFLLAVVDDAAARWNADRDAIVVCGISNGAMMSLRLAREASARIRAVAAVAASLPADAPALDLERPVPLYQIHGDSDPLVPFAGGTIVLPPLLGGTSEGDVIGAEATAAAFAAANGLPGGRSASAVPDTADDGMTTTRYDYNGSAVGTAVRLDVVAGGGHSWPGGYSFSGKFLVGPLTEDYDACVAIWDFAFGLGQPPRASRRVTFDQGAWVADPPAPYQRDGRVFDQIAPGITLRFEGLPDPVAD